MNKRWIGVVASIALAVIGTYLLVNYVQGADERALEGEETVEVLVVTEPVARGTAAEEIEDSVETVLVPAKLQTPGSVGDLLRHGDRGRLGERKTGSGSHLLGRCARGAGAGQRPDLFPLLL